MKNDKISQEEERVFANMQKHGWSTRWGDDGTPDEECVTAEGAKQAGCGCSMCACKSAVKPLLVIQLTEICSGNRAKLLYEKSVQVEEVTGYKCLIVDSMDEAKVQVFGVDAPGLDTLTLDQLIDMLEALKRMREAAGGGIGLASP